MAGDEQLDLGAWTFNQERAHLEDLVHKRVALLLTLFSAVIAGVISNDHFRIVVLFLGTVICGLLGETIVRVHRKLDLIVDLLDRTGTHPIAWTNRQVGGRSGHRLVGVVIPRFCTAILLSGLVIETGGHTLGR